MNTLRKTVWILLCCAISVSACNMPTRPNSTPTPDAVATQVSQLLTSMPTASSTLPANVTQPVPTISFSATPTPTISATPMPTIPATPTAVTLQPSPTAIAGDPKSALGEPTWRDPLDTAQNFHLYDNDHTRVTQENGALLLTGINADGWLGWSLTFHEQPQNFYLENTYIVQTCSGADTYGVVFRAPSTADAGYFFSVTCDGKYNLHARNFKDGSDVTLIASTVNAAIQSGSNATNRLGVMAQGNKISLYANGALLQEMTDATFPDKGYFGGSVAANATTGFTARLDEITLWTLP